MNDDHRPKITEEKKRAAIERLNEKVRRGAVTFDHSESAETGLAEIRYKPTVVS